MYDILKDSAMRFFKKPWFQRFAEKEGITDAALKSLVKGMEEGRINADLGGFVYKQRLAREGGGKSRGYRALLFYRKGDRVFRLWLRQVRSSEHQPAGFGHPEGGGPAAHGMCRRCS